MNFHAKDAKKNIRRTQRTLLGMWRYYFFKKDSLISFNFNTDYQLNKE
jgi:hypothetical protein